MQVSLLSDNGRYQRVERAYLTLWLKYFNSPLKISRKLLSLPTIPVLFAIILVQSSTLRMTKFIINATVVKAYI